MYNVEVRAKLYTQLMTKTYKQYNIDLEIRQNYKIYVMGVSIKEQCINVNSPIHKKRKQAVFYITE